MKNTCYECPDRHIGCHSICEKYITRRKQIDERNAKIREEKLSDSLFGVSHNARQSSSLMFKQKKYRC